SAAPATNMAQKPHLPAGHESSAPAHLQGTQSSQRRRYSRAPVIDESAATPSASPILMSKIPDTPKTLPQQTMADGADSARDSSPIAASPAPNPACCAEIPEESYSSTDRAD